MLTSLKLYQFKTFKDEDIELSPLTLLTGINGMGKSTIIQSLLVLRQSFDRGELQNNKRLVIEDKDLVNLISPEDMLYSDAESTRISITLSDDNKNEAKWSVNAEGHVNTLPLTEEEITGEIYSSVLFSGDFQYLDAERIGPKAFYERLTVGRPHSLIGFKGEYAASRILDSLNKDEKVRLKEVIIPNISPSVYDQLSAWVSEIIYEGTRVSIDVSDQSKIKMGYSFRDDPTKAYNPVNIGFGFSFALPVILAALTASPGSLLIIENPEAHLHPKGQSRMGRLLALAVQSGLQVIVETHSDHLLNGIRVAVKKGELDYKKTRIHFFTSDFTDKGKEKYKIPFQIRKDGQTDRWPKDFFDEWENNLDELIK